MLFDVMFPLEDRLKIGVVGLPESVILREQFWTSDSPATMRPACPSLQSPTPSLRS